MAPMLLLVESFPASSARVATQRSDFSTTDPTEGQFMPGKELFQLVLSLRNSKHRLQPILTLVLRELRMSFTLLTITSQALLIRTALYRQPQSSQRSTESKNLSQFAPSSTSCTGLRTSILLLRLEMRHSRRLFKLTPT